MADPRHPLGRRERIFNLLSSLAFGLAATCCVILWFYYQGDKRNFDNVAFSVFGTTSSSFLRYEYDCHDGYGGSYCEFSPNDEYAPEGEYAREMYEEYSSDPETYIAKNPDKDYLRFWV